jgi:hypothetical protein
VIGHFTIGIDANRHGAIKDFAPTSIRRRQWRRGCSGTVGFIQPGKLLQQPFQIDRLRLEFIATGCKRLFGFTLQRVDGQRDDCE